MVIEFGAFQERLSLYLAQRRAMPFLAAGHMFQLDLVARLRSARLAAPVRLQVTDAERPAGDYLFALYTWQTLGARPESRVAGFAVDLDTLEPAPDVAQGLPQLLLRAEATDRPVDGRRAGPILDALVEQQRRQDLAEATPASSEHVDRTLRRLDAHHHRATRLAAAESPVKHERVDRTYLLRRAAIEASRTADVVGRRLAAGTLVVRPVGPCSI
nr:hypothetical protein GCM10020063_040570 [Dactylosporangium thailandense]